MIRSYRPMRRRELNALDARAAAAASAWAPRWLSHGQAAVAAAAPLRTSDLPETADRWLTLHLGDSVACATGFDSDTARALAAAIVEPEPLSAAEAAHPLVAGLVERSLAELLRALAGAGARDGVVVAERPADGTLVPGAGDAVVTLGLGPAQVRVFVTRAGVDRVAGERSPRAAIGGRGKLEPRARAISTGRVRLEVLLQEAGLSIADVRRLRPQDVVMFDHDIARPLQVRVENGPEIGSCYLGRRGQRRAVKLVRNEEIP